MLEGLVGPSPALGSVKPLFMRYINLKAAYDWVDRDLLFNNLDIRLKILNLNLQ